jgi:Golgi nucleoside diphosphatase
VQEPRCPGCRIGNSVSLSLFSIYAGAQELGHEGFLLLHGKSAPSALEEGARMRSSFEVDETSVLDSVQ